MPYIYYSIRAISDHLMACWENAKKTKNREKNAADKTENFRQTFKNGRGRKRGGKLNKSIKILFKKLAAFLNRSLGQMHAVVLAVSRIAMTTEH